MIGKIVLGVVMGGTAGFLLSLLSRHIGSS